MIHSPIRNKFASFASRFSPGITAWVDSACADCPGSLVPGTAAPATELHPGASDCAPEVTFASRDAQHKFLQRKGAHTHIHTHTHTPTFGFSG